MNNDREELVAPLLNSVALSEQAKQSLASLRVCVQPPLPAFSTDLRIHLPASSPLNLIQDRPKAWCLAFAVAVYYATWFCFTLMLAFRYLRPGYRQSVNCHQAGNGTAATVALPIPRDVHGRSSSTEGCEPALVRLPGPGLAVASAWDTVSPTAKVTAASAAGGAVAVGVGGGCVGFVGGGLAGAACGVVPAIFTLGLSIPIGFLLGGGAGAVTGTAVGGSVGFVGGGTLGYSIYSNREALLRMPCTVQSIFGKPSQHVN